MSIKEKFRDPVVWRKFHGTMTIIWILLIVPSLLWWHSALIWIVFMSVWANVGTHFGAWQATKAEIESATNPPKEPNGIGDNQDV